MGTEELSTDDILERISEEEEEKAEVKKEKKKEKIENQVSQLLNFQKKDTMPTAKELTDWFGHIIEINIEFFLIESKIPPYCPYCETWKSNVLERKWFKDLYKLLGLSETKVFISEVPCDWNCLHATDYYDPIKKRMEQYSADIDEMGENYFYAYGMDIEYFPAIRILLKSKKYKDGKAIFEAIFQGLGAKILKDKQYKFNGKKYTQKINVIEINILKSLLKFLRSLNAEDSQIPIHEKFSLFLGQYHRHIE